MMRPFNPILMLPAGAIILAAAPLIAATHVPFVPKVSLSAAGNPILGNPAAKTKVVEYMSYACGHCAHFHDSEYKSLRDGRIKAGTVSLEIRPIAHNMVGLAAAMAVQCGGPGRYYRNHALFLDKQGEWLGKIVKAPAAAAKTFETGDGPARMKAIARYAGFYEMMAERNVTEAQLNMCLSDSAAFDRVVKNTDSLAELIPSVPTPTFLVNGKLAGGTGKTPNLIPALGD